MPAISNPLLSPLALKLPKVPGPKAVGVFGIKDAISAGKTASVVESSMYERRTPARWARTLIDVPVSIGALGVGYGIGRLAADAALTQIVKDPKALAQLPNVAGVLAGTTSMGFAALNSYMRHRREQAAREDTGVLPPQVKTAEVPKVMLELIKGYGL
jgi:hypothetical protein